MKQALLDTDTISYYFRNQTAVIEKVDKYLQEYGFINLSVVTYYEIMNGLLFKDAKRQLIVFETFAELNSILPLHKSTAKLAAEIFSDLRKKGITIGHNDIMIAACALENNLTLVSNNTNHFQHIENLEIDNWSLYA
ncbi:MAG: type II toxin-antitoxin system VapC family toxin [Bacteroidia bacterium]|nr:type II toxin-antitoxin system VapC family toxin [Bacteroidia bacterium]